MPNRDDVLIKTCVSTPSGHSVPTFLVEHFFACIFEGTMDGQTFKPGDRAQQIASPPARGPHPIS